MTRRLLVLAAVAFAFVALAFGPLAAGDAQARLDRALARTHELRTVRFEMRAQVRADSPDPRQAPAGGMLNQEVHARGEIAFPDRLHLVAPIAAPGQEELRELVVIGDRAWSLVGGSWRRVVAVGAQNDPRALLEVLAGPGTVRFAGYGIAGGVPTYRVAIDLDAGDLAQRQRRAGEIVPDLVGSGRLQVEIGLFDDRIYRQEAEIEERSGELAAGAGLYRVRTTYAVAYSGFDAPVDIREPAGN